MGVEVVPQGLLSQPNWSWRQVNSDTSTVYMITKDRHHYYITTDRPQPAEFATRQKAKIWSVHVKIGANPLTHDSRAIFRHTFNNGSARNYPEGLELAIEVYLSQGGFGGLSLQQYLERMFPTKKQQRQFDKVNENGVR